MSGARRAVIADDDLVVRGALKLILQGMGIDVISEVGDGKSALSESQKQRPDLVCLDIEMPEMKGLDVLSRLRRDAPDAVVFLISAFATAQNVRGAMQLRADGVIAKPFNKDKVSTEIQRAFARRQLKK